MDTNGFWAQLLQVIAPVLLLAVTALATVLVNELKNWLQAQQETERRRQIASIVQRAVMAVEQVGERKGWSSQEKKTNALAWARAELTEAGIQVTEGYLVVLIESSVYEEVTQPATAGAVAVDALNAIKEG